MTAMKELVFLHGDAKGANWCQWCSDGVEAVEGGELGAQGRVVQ